MSKPIPILKLTLDKGVNYDDIKNNPQIVSFVIDEMVDAVKDGIKSKRRNISLFQIYDSNYIIGLDKKQWKPSLESALKHYENKEEYIKCSEIKKIIESL
jgi:hypothetical protein